eukprot:3211726-Rhodomonas_salina.1
MCGARRCAVCDALDSADGECRVWFQADSHASRMARFALDAVEAARQTPVCENDPSMGFVQIRGGFHSGYSKAPVEPRLCCEKLETDKCASATRPVVADVVGTTNLQVNSAVAVVSASARCSADRAFGAASTVCSVTQ